MSTGGTAPEALPNATSNPRGARQSRDAAKVALPTPSKTTRTPRPPVSSRTRAATSSWL
jgi:hypothetical protein